MTIQTSPLSVHASRFFIKQHGKSALRTVREMQSKGYANHVIATQLDIPLKDIDDLLS